MSIMASDVKAWTYTVNEPMSTGLLLHLMLGLKFRHGKTSLEDQT